MRDAGGCARGSPSWIFDLDDTLYSASRVFPLMEVRIREFLRERFGMGPEEARKAQVEWYREYGTSLRGLVLTRGVDPGDYFEYVEAVDLSDVGPAPRLRAALDRLPGSKLVFTNSSAAHAARILDRTGLAGAFDGVFDAVAAGFVPKPEAATFRAFIDRHAVDPGDAVMFDDMPRNLLQAVAFGMGAVLVGDRPEEGPWERTSDLAGWLESLGCGAPSPGR
jgi:putative hydrolase of the HAD superfamily